MGSRLRVPWRVVAVLVVPMGCHPAPEPATPVESASGGPTGHPAVEVSERSRAVPRPPGVVYRSELERATARGPAYLLRQLAPEPHRIDGRFVGYRVTRVFPDEPGLCDQPCDLHPGDVIVAVNGVRIERPEHLVALLEQVPTMQELRVDRLRDGVGESKTYRVLPDPRPATP